MLRVTLVTLGRGEELEMGRMVGRRWEEVGGWSGVVGTSRLAGDPVGLVSPADPQSRLHSGSVHRQRCSARPSPRVVLEQVKPWTSSSALQERVKVVPAGPEAGGHGQYSTDRP